MTYLKYFLIIFLTLAILSVLIKVIKVYQSRSFRGDAFNLLILNKDSTLIHLETNPKSLTFLTLKNFGSELKNKSRVNMSIRLKIPIDGIIILDNSDEKIEKSSLGLNSFVKFYSKKSININEMDLLKLLWKINGVKSSEVSIKEIENIDKAQVYSMLPEVFNETAIVNDKTSIEVINGTGQDGVGGRISDALRNEGFHIVSVGTFEQKESKIILRGSENNIVFKRLVDFFPFKIERKEENSISDITLILGKDSLK